MNELPAEFEELRISIDRARSLLESLVVRGLRACGADELHQLKLFVDEFERAGAGHVAAALAAVHDRADKQDRQAARALLMAQTSLRLLERLLTLRIARSQYEWAAMAAAAEAGELDGDELDGEDEQ